MSAAFIIGNGESRKIFPLDKLKEKGTIYGCNAIYRDNPYLCDRIVCVSPEMEQELTDAKSQNKFTAELIGPKEISSWNYVVDGDSEAFVPEGLKVYRIWQGGNLKLQKWKRRDFSETKGSGCSAVLHAAEAGFKDVVILGFDILGARQWEMPSGESSRFQNNIYKETQNYPSRYSMKAYLKFEWLYHLTQTFRRFKDTNFYFINRLEYINLNPYLIPYFRYAPGNIRTGIYADLMRYITGESVNWTSY